MIIDENQSQITSLSSIHIQTNQSEQSIQVNQSKCEIQTTNLPIQTTQQPKENIRVVIRVRPRLGKESDSISALKVDNDASITIINSGKTFTYDYVAKEDTTQEELFNITATDIAESALNGYNGTIFVYGQTGAGKTYTLLGKNPESKISTFSGLLPRTVDYIFNKINNDPEYKKNVFTIKCSFLEIYNEYIYDLLSNDKTNQITHTSNFSKETKGFEKDSNNIISNHQKQLSIKDQGDSVKVENLSEHSVTDTQSTLHLINMGLKNRATAPTAVNKDSSRSHAVFSICIENKTKVNNKQITKRSVFHLIDLAGSERQKNTETIGERTKEAGKINKSLMNLGHVIKTLVENNSNHSKYCNHIHYRDSKLTHLLKDSIGGNSKTCIVGNVSSAFSSSAETLSTLLFAQNAKMIKNKVVVNEEISNESLYKEEIRKLLEQCEGIKRENKNLQMLVKSISNGNTNSLNNISNPQINGLSLNINVNSMTNTTSNSLFNAQSLKALEQQMCILEDDHSKKEAKITELEKENTFLIQRLERLDIDYRLLNMEKREAEQKLTNIQQELTSTKEALFELKEQTVSVYRKVEEVNFDMKKKELFYFKQQTELNDKLNDINIKLASKEDEIKMVKEQLALAEGSIIFKDEKIRNLQIEIVNNENQIANANARIMQNEIDMIDLNLNYEKSLQIKDKDISILSQKEKDLEFAIKYKNKDLENLYGIKESLVKENEYLQLEIKKHKSVSKQNVKSIIELNKSKDLLEEKLKVQNKDNLAKIKSMHNLESEVAVLNEKIKLLEESLEHVNKEYSLVFENKNNASKMNSILNQKREISELQSQLGIKTKEIQAMENYLAKNQNFCSKNAQSLNQKITPKEIVCEIEKKTLEVNTSRSIMHEILDRIRNIFNEKNSKTKGEINNLSNCSNISNFNDNNVVNSINNFNLSDLAVSQMESKSLEDKFKFYIEQLFFYIEYLKENIRSGSNLINENQKKYLELMDIVNKQTNIFNDEYYPLTYLNNLNNISNISGININNIGNNQSLDSSSGNKTEIINLKKNQFNDNSINNNNNINNIYSNSHNNNYNNSNINNSSNHLENLKQAINNSSTSQFNLHPQYLDSQYELRKDFIQDLRIESENSHNQENKINAEKIEKESENIISYLTNNTENNSKPKSEIIKKLNEAEVIDKTKLLNSYHNLGKKRCFPKIGVIEEKVEENSTEKENNQNNQNNISNLNNISDENNKNSRNVSKNKTSKENNNTNHQEIRGSEILNYMNSGNNEHSSYKKQRMFIGSNSCNSKSNEHSNSQKINNNSNSGSGFEQSKDFNLFSYKSSK